MSAICGMLGREVVFKGAEGDLDAVLDALEGRGPDGAAVYFSPDEQVALGERRLKVNAGEADPAVVFNEDKTLAMVADGQVFNRAELVKWLEGRGHKVRDEQPCEVLLHLFEEGGAEAWRRVDGQFAVAIWDRTNKTLTLGRDFLGVRALYYHNAGQKVVFASEIKALIQHSQVPNKMDEVAASHYLTFLNVPGPRTLFAGISKLAPGSVAVCLPSGKVEVTRFWDLLDNPVPERNDESFYVDHVKQLHDRAVRDRMPDGPLAALVSGGNDSSANAALMARYAKGPLHTFTVGLADVEGQERYNDLIYAKQVADLIGSQHHELLLSTDEFLQTIPVTVAAMDDMVSEPSSIFLYHALRLAKDTGAKTVVTGEANDELCCGHGEMIKIRNGYYEKWLPFQSKPQVVRQMAALMAPAISPKRKDILQRAANNDEYFWNFETAWMESEMPNILTEEAWRKVRNDSSKDVVRKCVSRLRASEHGKRDYMNYIVYAMMQDYYFGNLMLGKLDLLSGALGLEARCPYTAPEYAHFVYNIPHEFKAKGGMVKYFFKKAIQGILPDEIIYRPKQGFRTPVVELFRGALGDWARPYLLDGGVTGSLMRREELDRLLQKHKEGEADYSNRLWTALMLNLWHGQWAGVGARKTRSASAGVSSYAASSTLATAGAYAMTVLPGATSPSAQTVL